MITSSLDKDLNDFLGRWSLGQWCAVGKITKPKLIIATVYRITKSENDDNPQSLFLLSFYNSDKCLSWEYLSGTIKKEQAPHVVAPGSFSLLVSDMSRYAISKALNKCFPDSYWVWIR